MANAAGHTLIDTMTQYLNRVVTLEERAKTQDQKIATQPTLGPGEENRLSIRILWGFTCH
jgi:hypothetical protein